MNPDSIEGSGYPLAFKVRNGITPRVVSGETPARDVFKVEARTMGGHQKEVLVSEGEGGTVWRLTSDEGAILKGSDLAPFPLAFYSPPLQKSWYATWSWPFLDSHAETFLPDMPRLHQWVYGSIEPQIPFC